MKTILKLFLSVAIFVNLASCSKKTAYNILDFGASANSDSLNTKAIQSAIDFCNKNGGGTVYVPEGKFLTGTLILKDSVTLFLEKNSELIGSIDIDDYINIDKFIDAVGQERGRCLIGAVDAVNVGIKGEGVINGRGEYFRSDSLKKTSEYKNDNKYVWRTYSQRPFLVRFVRSKQISVSGVKLKRPAAWTLHCFQCKGIKIKNVSINSRANKNNDGIDLDSSSDVEIESCTIESDDDVLCFKTTSPTPCENIKVKNCKLSSHWGAIKFGTESMGDFRNISIDSCLIYDTKGGGIKILSVDGANIDNINISNIKMENVDMPIFIRLGKRLNTYRETVPQPVGSIKNVNLKNITAEVWKNGEVRVDAPTGILITGIPNHRIKNINLENISISLPGGGKSEMRNVKVEEDEKRYPEYSFFGVLPAYGAYVRHAENIEIKGCNFSADSADYRHPVWFEDVHGSVVKDSKIEEPSGANIEAKLINTSNSTISLD